MGDIVCIKLMYATFLSCYFNSGNPSMCWPMKDYRPIYTMYDCKICEEDQNQKLLELLSDPKLTCEKDKIMKKFLVGVFCVYALSLSTVLVAKRFGVRNSNASISLTEAIISPLVVPVVLFIGILEKGDTVCVMGCK